MIFACKQPTVGIFWSGGGIPQPQTPEVVMSIHEKCAPGSHNGGLFSLQALGALKTCSNGRSESAHWRKFLKIFYGNLLLWIYSGQYLVLWDTSSPLVRSGSRFESCPSCSSGGLGRIVLCMTAMEPTLHNGHGTHLVKPHVGLHARSRKPELHLPFSHRDMGHCTVIGSASSTSAGPRGQH